MADPKPSSCSSCSSRKIVSSRNSSSSNPQWKYDVFLNFRGVDTRRSFTDHLYTALVREGIFAFRDDEELNRGKPISLELLQAIEKSRVALVVFSRDYASSTWCLEELAKIVDCMKEVRQTVFPIFYHVEPSHVRHQSGSFAEAFATHAEHFKDDLEKVNSWRAALTEVAGLSGFHLKDRHEAEFIQGVVEKIASDLVATLSTVSQGLVGIGSRVNEVMELLSSSGNDNDVEFIGIWGMSGIGKTTLARVLFEKMSNQFQARSLLENVREVHKKDGLAALQENLMCDAQIKTNGKNRDANKGISEIRHRLCHKKVLIIIDDIDHIKQLEALAGSREWFGQGSRIIITTRDEQLLIAHGVEKIYKPKTLEHDESLQLFSWKVFQSDLPPEDYMKLALKFIEYVKGHPLAIEVLGRHLRGKSIMQWESAFDRLKGNLDGEIMNALLIGFDGLHDKDKQIFLDIACFLKGMDTDHAIKILESFGFNPAFGLSTLIGKSLITEVQGKLWMHDLLQEMGWEIVRQECPKEPGNRSRLWHYDDVLHVLKYNTGTNAVEGIVLDSPLQETMQMNCDTFSKMKKLRYLKICNALLPQGLSYLSTEMRVIEWQGYPSKLLPQNFPSSKLVQLNMNCSRLKHLWKGFKALDNLKAIDLTDSGSLMETPDFTGVPNLKRLILQGCTKLSKVHQSIGILKQLVLLNMENCKSLKSLPCYISLESLETFILSGCSRLERFPEIVGDMNLLTTLYLDGTALKEVPLSIERLTGLILWDLSDCRSLVRLPNIVISSMTSLKKLILSGCSNLEEIPENIGGVECLEELDVSGTAIKQVPFSILHLKNLKALSCKGCKGRLSTSRIFRLFPAVCPGMGLMLPSSFLGLSSLTMLNLSDCNLVDGAIPNDLDHLSSLRFLELWGNNFTSIPESICRLSKLRTLSVRNCNRLQSLHDMHSVSIISIWAEGCTSLRSVDSDQYEVWRSFKEGLLCIIKRGRSPTYRITISESQFVEWLQNYKEPLRTTHGFSGGVQIIPKWFSHQSNSSSVRIQQPKELYTERKPWIGFALYVGFLVQENFDSSDFKVMHEFDCGHDTKEVGYFQKATLYHELTVKDVAFTGPSGYWLYITHAWFVERLTTLKEYCSSIKAYTITDSPAVEVKMSGARFLYDEQDVIQFIQAIKGNDSLRRISKNNMDEEIKSIINEQGGESSTSDETRMLMSEEEQGCKIDSDISLKEHLESLDLECYEGLIMSGKKTYFIRGNFTDRQTAILLGKILKDYSGKPLLTYADCFPQCEIPNWFCRMTGTSSATLPLPKSGSRKGWRGVVICIAFTLVHRHTAPSLDYLDPEKCHTIEFLLTTSTGSTSRWSRIIRQGNIIESSSKERIWISYESCGKLTDFFVDKKLIGCSSLKFTFLSNSPDITVRSYGYQFTFDDNVEEFAETIMQCSTPSSPQPEYNRKRKHMC